MNLTVDQMNRIRALVKYFIAGLVAILLGDAVEFRPVEVMGFRAESDAIESVEALEVLIEKRSILTLTPVEPEPVDPNAEPDPVDPPDPPEPEAGPRVVRIYRESADQTPGLAVLVVNLRDGQSAQWLREHGHDFDVIDDNGQPRLVISDTEGNVLHEGPIPETADNVIETIMRTGG